MTEKKRVVHTRKSRELQESEDNSNVTLTALEETMIRDEASSDEEASEIMEEELTLKRREMSLAQAEKLINQETPSRILMERPSWGAAGAACEIHTRQTYAMLLGRRGGTANASSPITGLYAGAKRIRQVVNAYRRGCPFAAQFLVRLEQDLNQVNELFELKESEVRKLVQGISRVQMKRFCSRAPARIDVVFVNPYAWHVLDLVLRFDDMVRILLPYRQVHMIDNTVYFNLVQELGRHLRRLFAHCNRYFFVGQEAVEKQDELYLAAVNQFGELDPEIHDGKLLPYLIAIPQSFVR